MAYFEKGNNVFIEHGGIYYKGHILNKVDDAEEGIKYLVHYSGWSSIWDEVVSFTRLLPDNEEGRRKKKEFDIERKRKSVEAKLVLPVSKSMNQLRQVFNYISEPRIPVKLPDSLCRILVNDWISIECEHKLVPLPRSPCVAQIIANFSASSENSSPEFQIVCDSFLTYFNKFIESRLLYKAEVNQLKSFVRESTVQFPSDYFGAEHLLRLLYEFPQLVVHTDVDEEEVFSICTILNEFYTYLENHTDLFLSVDQYILSGV